jgi:hypothetical protein
LLSSGLGAKQFECFDFVRFFQAAAGRGDEQAAVVDQRCVSAGEFDEEQRGAQRAGGLDRSLLDGELADALLGRGLSPGLQGLHFTVRQQGELKHGGLLQVFWGLCEAGGDFSAGGIEQRCVFGRRGIACMQAPAPGDGQRGIGNNEQASLAGTAGHENVRKRKGSAHRGLRGGRKGL